MRKNFVEWGRPKMVRRMHIACWIPKATNVRTGCVIPIASPLQQWLHERVSILRYTNSACLVVYKIIDNILSTPIINKTTLILYFVDRASCYDSWQMTNLTHNHFYVFVSILYMFRAT